MKRRSLPILVCVLLLTLTLPLAAADPAIPKPNSQFYVLDEANLLDQDTIREIVQTSAALQQKTKAQIVVVTVKSLQEAALEDYTLSILRTWGIGDQELDNGVLLFLALEDRALRIEVGYGLEGALPDAKTGRIQDEHIIPYFQTDDYNQGLLNGYRALAQVVAQEYQTNLESSPPQGIDGPSPVEAEKGLPGWFNVIVVLFLIFLFYLDHRYLNGFLFGLLLGMLLRGGRRGGGGGFGGGGFRGGGGSGGGGGSSRRW